jgi:hypothetical protein
MSWSWPQAVLGRKLVTRTETVTCIKRCMEMTEFCGDTLLAKKLKSCKEKLE